MMADLTGGPASGRDDCLHLGVEGNLWQAT